LTLNLFDLNNELENLLFGNLVEYYEGARNSIAQPDKPGVLVFEVFINQKILEANADQPVNNVPREEH
jgi:hypothetical protein